MQAPKSARHIRAANARWRAAELRADVERADGIEDRALDADMRSPIRLDLAAAGYLDVIFEPRIGYVSWCLIDARSGERIECAALKTLLHRIADRLPRTLGARSAM